MELEDLGYHLHRDRQATFAAHVETSRALLDCTALCGQLLELKRSNNQTGFHNINCAKDKRGRNNPYCAKFTLPGEKIARRSSASGCCRG
jgi:hypothetical protein